MYSRIRNFKRSLGKFLPLFIAVIVVVPSIMLPSLPASAAIEGIDLLVESIVLSPEEPGIGQTISVIVAVKNQGTQTAGECTLACYVDDLLLGTQQVGSLPSGGASNKMFNWIAQPGTHTIKAIIDSNGLYGEPDETNNIKNYTFSTLAPDLTISSFTWEPETPSRNDNVEFSVVIKNVGNFQSAASNVNLYIDDESKGIQNVIALAPNGVATITYYWAAPEGEHNTRVVVDEEDKLQESNEDNNESSAVIGTARPDLYIPSITFTPQKPSKNDIVTFTVTLTNQGGGRSGSCFVGCFVDEEFKETRQIMALESDGSTSFNINMTATERPRTLMFRVDYYNDILESNEFNNENSITMQTVLPDLVVKDLAWTPQNAGVGDDVTFTATIKNEGAGRAEASRGAFNFSGEYWGYVDIGALDPAQETTAKFTWPAEYGELTVRFMVDFDYKITETNELNNSIAKTVPIVLPDLVISDIDWSPINPSLGDMVTFNITMKNQSGGKAGSSQLGFLIDNVLLNSVTIFSLEPQATITKTFTWQAQNGRHTIKAVADVSRSITEGDEKNNEKSALVVPYMADLVIGTITWSPLSMSAGSEVIFDIEIKNTGSLKSGLFRVTCFVDNEITGDIIIENLEAGESAIGTFPWPVTTGSHQLNVVSDSSDQVFEIDEENNTKIVNLPPPDLMVESITRSPDLPSIGDNVTYTTTIFNQGRSNSQVSKVAFYLDGELQETKELPEVAPSGVMDVNFNWIATSGRHIIKMQADPDNVVTEIDETNNNLVSDFGTLTPDLVIDSIGWTVENLLSDENGNIIVTVKNIGNDVTEAFVLACLVDNNPAEEVDVEPVAAGETATVVFAVPLQAGDHMVVADADIDDEVIEVSESNNRGSLFFNTIVPDLVVKSIMLAPAEVFAGEEVTVNVNIENRGREVAKNVAVELMVNGVSLGIQDIAEIETGIVQPVAFKWTALEGLQELRAGVDVGGTVFESNENNNNKNRTVTITTPVIETTKTKTASIPGSSGGFFDSWWWIMLLIGLVLGGIFFFTTFRALRKDR